MKCGLEIHQRLDSKKLFCSCYSSPNESSSTPARIIERRQHPVASELGSIDSASVFEASANKKFIYLAPAECSCLVETDEEPPHELGREALVSAVEICTHFNSSLIDELQIMRKAVIDGSNTSGFQRTGLLATGGEISTSKGPVRIQTISLEEESAGIVERKDGTTIYRLDRLGIPLIEIATAPDILDSAHARETAQKIGEILRLSGKVQRGLGSIRQDLNVSIEGGARTEIKGAQELDQIPILIENEIKRQESLLNVISQVKIKLGETPDFPAHIPDVSSAFANTKCGLIQKAVAKKGRVLGLRLPKHDGLLGFELCPGRRYGTELSDYAKTAGVGGIIHSDEDMGKYQISVQELETLKARLGLEQGDAFVLVAAEERTARKALLAVWARSLEMEIPAETRKANPDGTSSYMRPLGTGARMYPETDIPPIRITREMVEGIKKKSEGKSPDELKGKITTMLNKELAAQVLRGKHVPLFLSLSEKINDAPLVAITLTKTLTELRRDGFEIKDVEAVLSDLFSVYSSGLFVKAAIPEILKKMREGKSATDAATELGLIKLTGEELQKAIEGEQGNISKIMAKYRLRIDGDDLRKLVGKKGQQAPR